jgi:glycosyltransferase involved in cell wall biosynthesis
VLGSDYEHLTRVRTARLDLRSPDRRIGRAVGVLGGSQVERAVIRAATLGRTGGGRVDVVVVNGATADGVRLLRMLPESPTVLVGHELSTGWMSNLDVDDRRLLLSRIGAVLAVSGAVRDYLVEQHGVDPDIVSVIPPPVDPPDTLPARPVEVTRCVVLGGGVADWRKAPELFVAAAHHCRRLAPEVDWEFRWFGGGSGTDPAGWPLEFEVARLGLTDVVTFLGPVDDPSSEFEHADILLSTAREDAAPLVTAEAAGWGLPIVAFDSGGVEELIDDGTCGTVVEYPDVVGLAQAVVDLARDPDRREKLGRSGARTVRATRRSDVVASGVAAWIRAFLDP